MSKKFKEMGPEDTVVSSVKSVGGAAPTTDENGEVDLSNLFTSANTYNRYEMTTVGNGTSSERVILTDRAVNVWTVDTSASTLYFALPERTAKRVRDLIIALDLTDDAITTAPTINISGSWLVDGSAFPTLTTGKVNLLLLSEMMTETTGEVTTGRLMAIVKTLDKA